ncbi:MAG: GTPase, partial [Patescibacteria group bacterium]
LTKAPIMLVVNKADQRIITEQMDWSEWSALGLGEPQYISSISGRGTGDLLDVLVPLFPKEKIQQTEMPSEQELRVAIVGRTNVGKSSILNRLIGEERVIVSPQPHTTREPQDTLLIADDLTLRIIDTVGMRKKTRVTSKIDKEGLLRSISTIERADIVILVLESTVTPSKQESRLVGIAKERGAGLMIVVNKWDLVEEKTTKTPKAYEDFFRQYFKGALWAPALFISALTGQRVARLVDAIRLCSKNRARQIIQEELDIFLARTIAHQKPAWQRGKKKPVIKGFRQTAANPPTFALLVNDRQSISFAYLRYLENRLREVYDFTGTPIRIHTEARDKKGRL